MDSEIKCNCDILEEIKGFQSIYEFERFQKYIANLIEEGELLDISVQKYYAGFPEELFRCKTCDTIWRLIHPDFPFKGLWTRYE
jgi:hypothetical protein